MASRPPPHSPRTARPRARRPGCPLTCSPPLALPPPTASRSSSARQSRRLPRSSSKARSRRAPSCSQGSVAASKETAPPVRARAPATRPSRRWPGSRRPPQHTSRVQRASKVTWTPSWKRSKSASIRSLTIYQPHLDSISSISATLRPVFRQYYQVTVPRASPGCCTHRSQL
jgi:hypothetical protein